MAIVAAGDGANRWIKTSRFPITVLVGCPVKRELRVEPLERRDLLAALWRNPVDSLDVDGDGQLAAIDALQIVNRLNGDGDSGARAAKLPDTRSDDEPYVDVDGDGAVTPGDALQVVESLNRGHVGARTLRLRADGPGSAIRPVDASERSSPAQSTFMISVGQGAGVRHMRLAIDTEWATTDALLEVRLIDPGLDYAGRSLLDGDSYAAPLLRLRPSDAGALGAEHPAGFTRWDGRILELALPDFQGRGSALLSVGLLSTVSNGTNGGIGEGAGGHTGDSDRTGGWSDPEGAEDPQGRVLAVATIRPLSNVVVENESWPPWQTPALPLAVGLSPGSDPDGNGVVLRRDVTLLGQTTPGTRLVAEVAAVEYVGADASAAFAGPIAAVETTADANGRFTIDARLATGANLVRVTARGSHGQQTVFERPILVGDVIVDWNQALLSIIRDWTTLSNDPYTNRVVTERPPVAARNLAMIHGAMYDAVNAIDGTHAAYRYSPDFTRMSTEERTAIQAASPVAAAATAAFDVAVRLYREADERAVFSAALAEALATVPDGPAKDSGVAIGRAAAAAMLAARQGDGASSVVSYSPGTAPGEWRRTFPDFLPPLLPQWPDVRPFAMTDGAQFRPPAPPSPDSAEYAADVDEVLRLGGFNSAERTADQTEIALFWADGGGTFTPPGHWNQIATEVSLARGLSLAENARLFALLDIALADAGIAAWDAKYEYDMWRPIDAIRLAATDGNPATTASPAWIPLLKTPPFPTYVSGHSTFSGAASAVLTALLGDDVAFVDVSDGHQGFSTRPLADQQIFVRQFSSFAAAAEEAGRSRIYGGIHFQFDNTAGLAAGRSIGRYVVDQLLRPVASS